MSTPYKNNSWLLPLSLFALLLCAGSLLRSSSAHAAESERLYFLGITQEGQRLPGLDEAVRQRLGALAVSLSPVSTTPDAACDGAPALTAAALQHPEELVLAGQIRTSAHSCLILLWLHKKDSQQVSTRELTCSKTWSERELATNVAELAGDLIEQTRQESLPEPAPGVGVGVPAPNASPNTINLTETVPPLSVPSPRPGWSPLRKTLVVISGLVFAGFLTATLRAAVLHGRPVCATPDDCDQELSGKLTTEPMKPARLDANETIKQQISLGLATGLVGTGFLVSILFP